MKKIILVLLASFCYSLQAQTYFTEDFSGGIGQFTSFDEDGDGNQWNVYDSGTDEGDAIYSASYDSDTGTLTPDNWLISSAIDLSQATSAVTLEWKVYAVDQDNPAENYTVYVGTTGTVAALSATTPVFNETLTTSDGYMIRYVNLAAFAGQTVYVAFRHHGVSSEYMMNIDDVAVTETPSCPPPTTLTVTNVTNTAADISWTARGLESAWEYVVQVAGQAHQQVMELQLAQIP
jgi:hypothetical protein